MKTLHIRSGRGSRKIFDPAVLFALAALLLAALPLILAKPTLLREQPFPDSQEYADAANQLARGNGYVTYVHGPEAQPPRYPPGYSVALLPFTKWGPAYPKGAELGAKVIVLALFLAVWGTTWLLGGPIAAGFAAGLAVTSSFWPSMSHLVLSDPLAATLVVLSLALLTRPSTKHAAVAGALVGASVVVRLANLGTLASLIAAPPRLRPRLTAILAALPFVVTLLIYQWSAFGQPLKTGYDYYLPGLRELATGSGSNIFRAEFWRSSLFVGRPEYGFRPFHDAFDAGASFLRALVSYPPVRGLTTLREYFTVSSMGTAPSASGYRA